MRLLGPMRFGSMGLKRDFSLFSLTTFINLAIGSLSIPILISKYGSSTWAQVATAQTVGLIFCIVISWGWAYTGSIETAKTPETERSSFYALTLLSRLLLAMLSIMALLVVFPFLSGKGPLGIYLAFTLSIMATGLSSPWFFTGEKKPWLLLKIDVLPRLLSTITGLATILLGGDLIFFPLITIAGVAASVVWTSRSIFSRYGRPLRAVTIGDSIRSLKSTRSALAITSTSAVYAYGPVVIANLISPSNSASYILADKFLKLGLRLLNPISQVFQGHTPTEDKELLIQRMKKALTLMLYIAVISGIGVAITIPTLASIFSIGKVNVDYVLSIFLGVSLSCSLMQTVTGLVCLVTLSRADLVAKSTLLGLFIGLPSSIVLGLILGIDGIATAVGISELSVLIAQLHYLKKLSPDLFRKVEND
jgi:O-antigen/teichoic acid export membrane protein